jgi:hypothetical protein
MKRTIKIIGIGIVFLGVLGYFIINLCMRHDVKNNIGIAEEKYELKGEEALIAFLEDKNNSTYDRTHIAVWTLGKIRSRKALPILHVYYYDDPEGKTCCGNHDSQLCQYEIHKAIVAIKKGGILSYSGLK